jgi:hypothetical protein
MLGRRSRRFVLLFSGNKWTLRALGACANLSGTSTSAISLQSIIYHGRRGRHDTNGGRAAIGREAAISGRDGRTDGWMDGWMHGWMDGWMGWRAKIGPHEAAPGRADPTPVVGWGVGMSVRTAEGDAFFLPRRKAQAL